MSEQLEPTVPTSFEQTVPAPPDWHRLPVFVPATVASALLKMSERTFWRKVASGQLPAPAIVGGKKAPARWHSPELRLWEQRGRPPIAKPRAHLAICDCCNQTKAVEAMSEDEARDALAGLGWGFLEPGRIEDWLPAVDRHWYCPKCWPRFRPECKDTDEWLGGDVDLEATEGQSWDAETETWVRWTPHQGA